MTAPLTLEEFKWVEGTTLREWSRWVVKFEAVLQIAKVKYKEQNNTLSVDYFVTVCGDKIIDIVEALPNRDTIDWLTLKPLIASRFSEPNLRYKKLMLRTAKQTSTESLDDFITRIRQLASDATIEQNKMDDELLEVISAGAHTASIRAKALSTETIKALLDWHNTQTLAEKLEMHMDADASHGTVAANVMQQRNTNNKQRKSKTCYNCGGVFPHTSPCPAKGKLCHTCNKPNHFQKCCRANKSSQKQYERRPHRNEQGQRQQQEKAYKLTDHDEREELEELRARFAKESSRRMRERSSSSNTSSDNDRNCTYKYRGYANAMMGGHASPKAHIMVNGQPLAHIVDTGATMNIMSSTDYCRLSHRPKLYKSKARIYAFGADKPTRTLGEFECKISYNHKNIKVIYVVVDDANLKLENLLSHKASVALDIVKINLETADQKTMDKEQNQSAYTLKSEARAQWRTKLFERYKKLFEPRVGKLKGVKVHIDTDPAIKPTQQPPYKIPFHLIPATRAKLDEMVTNKIIERVSGPCSWISPMHPVLKAKKKNGQIQVRITSNNKCLNKAIISQKRHMPYIEELVSDLEGANFVSVVDVNDAFHQIDLDEDTRNLTVFSTPWGLYRYKRLNMGLCVSSEIFQGIMDNIFADLKNVKAAMDDILVYAKTQAIHDETLSKVLSILESNGFTLNKDKSQIDQSEVEFYGMMISKNGIRPKADKLQDLLDADAPVDVKTLRSFMGLASYFSPRIPNLASLAIPLRKLQKKNNVWHWGPTEQQAFDDIKQTIIKTCLGHFNREWNTQVIVDASPKGVACYVVQYNPKKTTERHLLACGSKAFNDVEKRWSQAEKECFAAVFGCEHSHIQIYGHPFELVTDNKAVFHMLSNTKLKGRAKMRFERFRSRLAPYQYTMGQVKGENNIADYLSRCFKVKPYQEPIKLDNDYATNALTLKDEHAITEDIIKLLPNEITYEQLVKATAADQELAAVALAIERGRTLANDGLSSAITKNLKDFWINEHGIIMREHRIVIPAALQNIVITLAHGGHLGSNKGKRWLRAKYWFTAMDSKLEQVVAKCMPCLANVDTTKYNPLRPNVIPPHAWHEISIDHSSRTPSGTYGLVIVCERSRMAIVEHTANLTAEHAIKALRKVFRDHGVPCVLKSDNGPAFRGHEFRQFAQELNFKHKKITPLWPRGNAMCERFMPAINKAIRVSTVEGSNWRTTLKTYVQRYNETPHPSTGIAPNVAMSKNFAKDSACMKKMDAKDQNMKMRAKRYTDANLKAKEIAFNQGDVVLLKWDRPNKHMPLFDYNPYKVIEVKGTMVTAKRSNHQITRNSKFFKKINNNFFIDDIKEPKARKISFIIPNDTTDTLPVTVTPPQSQTPRVRRRHQPDPPILPPLGNETITEEQNAMQTSNSFAHLVDETIDQNSRILRPRQTMNYNYKQKHSSRTNQ
jgi:hypothetical protein